MTLLWRHQLRRQSGRTAAREDKPRTSNIYPSAGCVHPCDRDLILKLFYRPYFHIQVIPDVAGVSLAGALKNVVALAAGFVEGKGWGNNAKAAVIRVGLLEMIKFGGMFFAKSVNERTFTEESACVADLIASCSAGRNLHCAQQAIQRGVSVEAVGEEEMNGRKPPGSGVPMHRTATLDYGVVVDGTTELVLDSGEKTKLKRVTYLFSEAQLMLGGI